MTRPHPPDEGKLPLGAAAFAASPELADWALATFVASSGSLHNPDHAHLADAHIGWLWTNAEAKQHSREILGEARLVPPAQARWSAAASRWQLAQWFGDVPDFTITLSAGFATFCDDASFCALVEHELYHCAQAVDSFGMPRFSSATGEPIFGMRGHDVEEFVEVVRRYGAGATRTHDLATALADGPTIGAAHLLGACGTCSRKAA